MWAACVTVLTSSAPGKPEIASNTSWRSHGSQAKESGQDCRCPDGIRRKAKAVAEALVKRAQAARKKITKVVRKRAPKGARAAGARRRKRVTA